MSRPRARLGPLVGLCLAATGAAAEGAPASVSFPGANGVTIDALIYLPEGAGPHPAVVALHGCAGLTERDGRPSARHDDWGQRLAAQGFVVLMPDSFGSRGLGPQCKVKTRSVSPARERVADAEAARDFLAARPDVRPDAINLLGWSNGGSSVLHAVASVHRPPAGRPDFARAVAFYPGCRKIVESGAWSTRMPLLILIGTADDWTPAAPCQELAEAARGRGEDVTMVTYPGAYHDFDHPDLPVHVVSGLAFTASGSGTAHTGTDPTARAAAILRVPAFLAR